MLDRLFALRYHDNRLYLPQAVPVVAGLHSERQSGNWYLIRADWPTDAFHHQRELIGGVGGHLSSGHCRCPVEALGQGSWKEVLSIAGDSASPVGVPDARVAISRYLRWQEYLGDGNWQLPMPES